MRPHQRLLLAQLGLALVVVVLLGAFTAIVAALVGSTLTPQARALFGEALARHAPLGVLAALALAAGLAAVARPLVRRYVAAPSQLLEQARVLVATDAFRELTTDGNSALRGLAQVVNDLALLRSQLRADIAAQVAQASRSIEQERNRLAALMSELTQSVVVCNLDGRILLYNNRARLQFRALSESPQLGGGAELLGLGRSIYTVFDRKLVAHALERVQQRLARGVASPSAQFVTTTRSGQLLRAQLAAVRAVDAGDAVNGFVLLLDNITTEYELDAERDRVLHGLTEGSRGALANLRAAAEMLDDADLAPELRERFVGVVRSEAQLLSRRIDELAQRSNLGLATRWPLEEILADDFMQAVQRRIEAQTGLRTRADTVPDGLWLKLDSFAMMQALATLAQRLRDEFEVKTVQLRLAEGTGPGQAHRARLDLVWSGRAMSTETVMTWEMDTLVGAEGSSSALTLRDVVQRHAGEFWFERDRVRHEAFFRFLVPLAPMAGALQPAQGGDGAAAHHPSRPVYYDFDLFAGSDASHVLDERRLTDLTFTVFDTETTGLDPTGGDEIIQIGATRIVNGRLLRGECFDQLVDPRRSIPAEGIPIHGITPEMVAGKPAIDEVLPAFHAYAQDTILVAHNAAFDMRFLQLKEATTGLRFDQPVLDTLLLSEAVHPQQDSHRLEAIAERFGVTIIGRHTALGDALVTAEIFLRLVPLLAEKGIHTLGQARAAAQKSWYARVQY